MNWSNKSRLGHLSRWYDKLVALLGRTPGQRTRRTSAQRKLTLAVMELESRLVPSTVIYQRDFEPTTSPQLAPGASASWSQTGKTTTPSGQTFLGEFGNQTVNLTLNGLPTHDAVTIGFDLYVLKTWDGSDNGTGSWGPDHWSLTTGGTTLFDATFANRTDANSGHTNATQSFGGQGQPLGDYAGFTGAAEHGTLGYNIWRADFNRSEDMSAVYHLEFTVQATAATQIFSFTGSGLQGISDESWGLDNVKVTANRAPVASNQSASTNEDTAKSIALAATDPDGDALSYLIVSGPSHGTLSGSGASRVYTPETNYNGPDSFTFRANDGTLDSNVATVSLTVNAVNDAPTLTLPGPQTVTEDTDLALSGILVADIDAGEGAVCVTLSVGRGTLTVQTGVAGGLTAAQVSGNGTATVVLTAPLGVLNVSLAAPGGLTYRGVPNYHGPDTLTVSADDQGNMGSGGPQSASGMVSIIVNATVNLLADTNMDGAMNAADDTLEDDEIGKLVFVNSDDDDGDLIMDSQAAGAVLGEDDLAEVMINIPADFDGMTVRLKVTGDTSAVQLWSAPDRTGVLSSLEHYYEVGVDPIPAAVYVEGLQTGVVTLKLEVLDAFGAVFLQNGAPVADVLRVRITRFELDVTDNLSTGDVDDGFWNYMPGYRGATPVLSSGAFNALTPLAPQPLHAMFDGLGTAAGVGSVAASLVNISSYTGYAENAPDPGDGTFSNMKDVSFSRTADKVHTETTDDGAVVADKAWINLFVRDYAAKADLIVAVFDTAGRWRGHHQRQVVRDSDRDGLQDRWEVEQRTQWENQYWVTALGRPLDFFSPNLDDENEDPDGAGNGDGGRNLPAQKTKGDSLTVGQEYRGFILDGGGFDGLGAGGHAGGHTRLSPAFKELLVEIDMMPTANVAAMPTAAGMNTIMQGVARGFSDRTSGAGIRTYWVVDEASATYQSFSGAANEVAAAITAWTGDHRNASQLGEFVHLSLVGGVAAFVNNGGFSGPGIGSVIFTTNIAGATNAFYSYLITHELTHTLLNTSGANGFNANEHMDDPDPTDPPLNPLDGIYIMHEYVGNPAPNNNILFHDLELAQIDLKSKESVER